MYLEQHHRIALLGTVGLGTIAVSDAATMMITGHSSWFADENHRWIVAAGSVVHGLAYMAILRVLFIERARIRVNRTASVCWWLLVVAFGIFAVVYLGPGSLGAVADVEPLMDAAVGPITFAFVAHFLAGAVLGLALLRHPETAPGSRVLLAILPLMAVVICVGVLAGDRWAHPAWLEVTILVGISTLCAATRPHVPAHGSRSAGRA